MKRIMQVVLLVLCSAGANAAPLLTGSWSGTADGSPLTVQFAANGDGTVNGEPMHWQLMGNLLFVEQGGEVAGYQVQQQGDTLTVSGGGLASPAVLTRGTGAKAKAAGKPAGSSSGGGDRGALATELVGKWCKGGSFSANSGGGSSSMACFELRADGTYTYEYEGSMSAYAPGAWGGTASQNSDQGRWSVSGGALTARSVNGQTASYRLEKRNHPKNRRDPMICLDGDCYTSFWQKPAW